jgi:ribosomal protein S18 acetylase RimI-like enzyme
VSGPVSHVLDSPTGAALSGPHGHLAERRGRVLRYPLDVCPFHAFPDDPDEGDWRDLADLVGPGAVATLPGAAVALPPGWEIAFSIPGVQMIDNGVAAAHDPDAVVLGAADVAEMLALVERTRPGPFRPRTIEMGTYLGIRRRGRLVAMAGERLHPPGWTEISAVCTDPEHRGQGLATRLVLAVAAGVRDRGETPFLHAAAANTGAVRLYEALGFRLRRTLTFGAVRVPAADIDSDVAVA